MNPSNLLDVYSYVVKKMVKNYMMALTITSLFCGFMDILVGLCGYTIPSYVFGLFMVFNGIALFAWRSSDRDG